MLVSMSVWGRTGWRRFTLALLAFIAATGITSAAGTGQMSVADCAGNTGIVADVGAPTVRPVGTVVPTLAVENGTGIGAIRLDGIVLPAVADPAVRQALRARLGSMADQGPVVLRVTDRQADRHGRRTGQLVDAAGRWVQADLVADGLAVAEADDACAADLLAVETEARRAMRGIWAAPGFPIRIGPDGRARLPSDFVVVEGRVRTVGNAGRTTYLNFGADFGRDVTIVLDGRTLARFDADKRLPAESPAGWTGRLVRVRGWATAGAGGEIRLAGPDALEMLDGEPPSAGDDRRRTGVPPVDDK